MADKLKEQFFDFEVFPKWWCCVIGKYPQDDNFAGYLPEHIKDEFIVVTSDDTLARDKLLSIVKNRDYVNIGYNIKRYDNVILSGVAKGFTPHQLSVLSDCVINEDAQYKDAEHAKIAQFAYERFADFVYQDMLDDNTGSLKDKEACMQLDIRESTVPFDKEDLTDEDKAEIISYCKHDVWSSMQFYKIVLKPFVATKLLVGKVFNIPMDVCYKSTNAQLSAKALGAVKKKFNDAERVSIVIPNELKDYIRYALPEHIVHRICTSKDSYEVELFGNDVTYANGGIHSVPIKPKELKKTEGFSTIVEANDEWALVNADAASFYPATMIHWHGLSRAVHHPEKFAEMYHARLNFKKVIEPFEDKYGKHPELAPKEEYDHYKYCKETSQAYKLILNTTYGASGNKYLALYDPYMTTYTCRIGQLLLTSLANNIYKQIGKENVAIIQTNTDGILCYIRRNNMELLKLICDQFTEVTHIMIELEEEKKIWQRDVNNYIMLKKNGKVKSKGGFFVTDMIQPGYNRVRPLDCYVCRDAIKEYLINGEDIVEHIYNEEDISKFVVTCSKVSASGIYRTYTDGRPPETLHRCNRAYATTDTSCGEIKVYRMRKGVRSDGRCPGCPPHAELINEDLRRYDMRVLRERIDYMWYINETIKLLTFKHHWFVMEGTQMREIEILPEDYL